MEENFTPVVSNEVTSVTNFDESYYAGKANFSFDKLASYLIRFLNQLKKTGRSVNTINAYRNDLSLFCEFLVEKQIRPDHYASPVQDYWIQFLKKNGRRSQASIRRAQMSVRSFLHYLVADGVIDKSAFQAFTAAGISFPISEYLSDYMPLNLGLGTTEISLRAILKYEYHSKISFRRSAAYLHKPTTEAERA